MTRYAIDDAVALLLVRDGVRPSAGCQLVGPARLRSDALGRLHRAVRSGELDEATGRTRLEGLAGLPIRLLGDRVSRAVAWTIAGERGWDDTGPAEYLAVAKLQADRLVTLDPRLADAASVPLAALGELYDLAGRPRPEEGN